MKRLQLYNPTGFRTLLDREIHRFMKIAVQTLLAPLLSNVLYLGVFGGLLKTRQVGLLGTNYLLFLVPGLATMGAIFAAFQNPSFSMISQKFQNTIQDLNSYPISNLEKTLAFVLGGTIRGVLIGLLTYLAAACFVGFQIVHPFGFLFLLGVVSFIFAALGLIAGLLFDSYEKLNFVLTIVIVPLAYFGGVFFELGRLTGSLAVLKYLNPIFPLVGITRYAYLGISDGNLALQALMAAGFTIVSFLAAFHTLERGWGLKV
jgi:ABC-2 type transport system permease protein